MMIGGLVRMRRRCQRCDCQSNKDGQRWRNSVSGKSPLRTVSRQREPLTNCDPEFFCIVKEGGSRMLVDDLYLFTRSSVVDTVNKGMIIEIENGLELDDFPSSEVEAA